MHLGIVGFGVVGQHLASTFAKSGYSIAIYDKHLGAYSSENNRDTVQRCDLAFVAVPTNLDPSGAIDLSEVEEVVSWLSPPICIKSTIVPGTTDHLRSKFRKSIIFSPEYIGETVFHKYKEQAIPDLVVFGGERSEIACFSAAYKSVYGPSPRYFYTDAVTAELSKYMENCFFATKLTFLGQFQELAREIRADFDTLREIWVADSRVGTSHSISLSDPGFAGRCLPKDLAAIISFSGRFGGAPLLEAVQSYNNRLRTRKEDTAEINESTATE